MLGFDKKVGTYDCIKVEKSEKRFRDCAEQEMKLVNLQ